MRCGDGTGGRGPLRSQGLAHRCVGAGSTRLEDGEGAVNWVTAYCDQQQKPARFEKPDAAVERLQESLSRWSGSRLWAGFAKIGPVGRS